MTLLTIEEASKYLNIHPMTTHRLVKSKQLPATKVGGQWRIFKDIIETKFNESGNIPRV